MMIMRGVERRKEGEEGINRKLGTDKNSTETTEKQAKEGIGSRDLESKRPSGRQMY